MEMDYNDDDDDDDDDDDASSAAGGGGSSASGAVKAEKVETASGLAKPVQDLLGMIFDMKMMEQTLTEMEFDGGFRSLIAHRALLISLHCTLADRTSCSAYISAYISRSSHADCWLFAQSRRCRSAS
jgi:hypothetical protein